MNTTQDWSKLMFSGPKKQLIWLKLSKNIIVLFITLPLTPYKQKLVDYVLDNECFFFKCMNLMKFGAIKKNMDQKSISFKLKTLIVEWIIDQILLQRCQKKRNDLD